MNTDTSKATPRLQFSIGENGEGELAIWNERNSLVAIIKDEASKGEAQRLVRSINERDLLNSLAGFMIEARESFLDAVDRGDSAAAIVDIMRGFMAGDVITEAIEALEAHRKELV